MIFLMPTLFISHGSPMLALEEEPTTRFLRSLSAQLPRPKAIVIASAHWETGDPMITGSANPETIHDFSSFPKELYQLRYPVPGDPALAEHIQLLLTKAGFKAGIDPTRGLDHGAWNPLLLMYPAANIPVIELSVQPERDAQWHYQIGQALSPLREEEVLVIGTGNLTHNLREAFRGHHVQTPSWVSVFARWVADKVEKNDTESLLNWKHLAPHARENHPTPEHFLPLFVALGAAENVSQVKRLNVEMAMGVLAMDVYAFGKIGNDKFYHSGKKISP
ncbi:MAG: dioxygenase [Pseudomonadota bacterium]|nr:dioxygenase [Pseudomonadota bacterium]